MRRTMVTASALALGLGMAAYSEDAKAAVFIGLQQAGVNGGAIQQVAAGGSQADYDASYGTFEGVDVALDGFGFTAPPQVLNSTTIAIDNAVGAGGEIKIYVTVTNIVPGGSTDFSSALSVANISENWTETLATYYDNANGIFTTTNLLASQFFNTSGGGNFDDLDIATNTPFSVTGVFTINAPNVGGSNAGIIVEAETTANPIPEPASLVMLLGSLASLGIFGWRQRNGKARDLANAAVS